MANDLEQRASIEIGQRVQRISRDGIAYDEVGMVLRFEDRCARFGRNEIRMLVRWPRRTTWLSVLAEGTRWRRVETLRFFSDDETERRAELEGGRWVGPEEVRPCPRHLHGRETYRLAWWAGTDVDDADPVVVKACSLCADEDDFGTYQGGDEP